MQNSKITLTFSTTAGDLTAEFPKNQSLSSVKTAVMAKLKLDPSKADEFIVTLGGVALDENKKLGELGLEEGALLVIEHKEVVKI